MISGFRLVAIVSLVLAASVAIGVAHAGEPVPGVDIKLGKNPGDRAVVIATTDREGRFSAEVRVERGEYAVTTSCAPRRPCRPNRVLSLSVDGREIRPNARGVHLFPIGTSLGTVMIRGRVETLEATSTPR